MTIQRKKYLWMFHQALKISQLMGVCKLKKALYELQLEHDLRCLLGLCLDAATNRVKMTIPNLFDIQMKTR
ncbi:unnamed protein product [Camellia sinensis]